MNIVNVGYSSTNYYLIEDRGHRLLIDVGIPGTYRQLLANLQRADVALTDIPYLIITHYHPDHAGIVEEVKASGVRLVVLEPQRAAIDYMRQNYIKPDSPFIPIQLDNNRYVKLDDSRDFLQEAGFAGEIIATPGHSDDSVSLVFDDGNAFIGDLTLPTMADDNDRATVLASWQRLRELNAHMLYAGHAPVQSIDQIGI